MANYYLGIDDQRRGPFPEEELLQNGMTPDSLVWCKGMDDWKMASQVPELAKYFAQQAIPPVPPQNVPQYVQPQYEQPQYGQPQYGQPQYPQPQYAQPQYGQPQYDEDYEPPFRPDSHLSKAIWTTICCCPPFGIVAIIKAASVNRLYDEGKYDEADEASYDANKWANIAIKVGIGIAILNFIYLIFVIINASNHSYY